MTTMTYAGEGRPRNRREVNGQKQILCQKCGEWKDATDENFYRYATFLRSPCKSCQTAARRVRLCDHDGCQAEISFDNQTGYCRDHYYLHIAHRREQKYCSLCGVKIAYESTTGLCRTCYISSGKCAENNANNGKLSLDYLPRSPEFYSNLGELPESPGYAISAPGRFWRQR